MTKAVDKYTNQRCGISCYEMTTESTKSSGNIIRCKLLKTSVVTSLTPYIS